MVSGWWVLAAFVAGGYAGMLLTALMAVSQSTAEAAELPPAGAGGIAPGSSVGG